MGQLLYLRFFKKQPNVQAFKRFVVFIILINAFHFCTAQNIGINNTGEVPHSSAMLDVYSTSSGLLIPRVALLSTTNTASPIASPTVSLVVYNTATAGTSPFNVIPGFYYYNGSEWSPIGGNLAWSVFGNSGTTAGTNFLGTTNAQDLVIKTATLVGFPYEKIRITRAGDVGIGTFSPTAKVEITGDLLLTRESNRTISVGNTTTGFTPGASLTLRSANGVNANGGSLNLFAGDAGNLLGSLYGGDVNITAGNAAQSVSFSSGGSVNITSGVSYQGSLSTTTGSGNINLLTPNECVPGQINLTAGNAIYSNNGGGRILINSGMGSGNSGGSIALETGIGAPGGPISLTAGNGRNSGNVGGAITIAAGSGSGAATGGAVSITAGDAGTSLTGGAVNITAGSSLSSGDGGAINLVSGSQTGLTTGGAINLTTPAGGWISGGINLITGTGGLAGGSIGLTAGSSPFIGGGITLQGGNNTAVNPPWTGGPVNLIAGNSKGSTPANITLTSGTCTVAGNPFGAVILSDSHFKSVQTKTPTVTTNANAGTSATSLLTSATDMAGRLSVTTGSGAWATGEQTKVNFKSSYSTAPIVVITPADATSAAAMNGKQVYITSTTTTFSLNFGVAATSAVTYVFWYHVIETQ